MVSQKRTVLVTGGAGFIGSHTAEALLNAGFEVRVIDDLSTGHRHNLDHLNGAADLSVGDIRDPDAVADAVSGCMAVVNLAAQVSVPVSFAEPGRSAAVNIGGFANVLEQAAKAGATRIIYASSAAIYGDNPNLPLDESEQPDPQSPYGLEKLTNEHQARILSEPLGLRCLGLRFFNVYGPRQDPGSAYSGVISKFADVMGQKKAPTIFGDGKQTRDFVYAGDVARAIVAAIDTDTDGVINICTGRSTSINGLAATLGGLTGVNAAPAHAESRIGDIKHSLGNPGRMHSELGITAETDINDGLAALLESLHA